MRQLRSRLICSTTLLFLAAFIGCTNSSVHTEAADASVPEDFSMIFGQGGGFAWLWSGYTIQALWKQIQKADYFNQNSRETGNMTAFMEVTAESTVHRTSWIPIVEGIEEPTTPLEILYVSVSALAREAGG